jgi:cellobiose phosphorylase
LIIEPRVPADWKLFKVKYTLNENIYNIEVTQQDGQFTLTVNGLTLTNNRIELDRIASEPIQA